jgi:tetratricopeptide (TPR) repeat protein
MVRSQPLDARGSGVLVTNLLGGEGSSGDVGTMIVQAAEGNPLFIEEMLRMLVDQGVLVREDGGWSVAGDLASVGRPETVHAVIAARLDGLDAGERSVLQTASVIGEVFWWNAVADLSDDVGAVDVARRLQALVRKDLIRPDPSTFFSEDAFRFGHLLIRDVAYESLPKKARAYLHERFARWVEERAAQRTAEYAEIIGYHAEQASRYLLELGPADERARELAAAAAVHLSSAGSRSFDRGDMPAAVNLMTRAAALLPDQDPRLVPVLRVLALALTDNGRLDDAEEAYARMRDVGRAQGDRRGEMRAEASLQFLHILRSAEMTHGDYLEIIEPVHAFFEEVGDDAGLSETFRYMGTIEVWAGRCEAALQRFEEALAAATRVGDRRLAFSASHWIGLALAQGPTPVDEAIERIETLVRNNAGDRMFRWQTDRYKIELLAMREGFVEARALADEEIEFAVDMGLEGPPLAAGLLRASGEEAYRSGHLDRAEADLRRAVEILVRIGDKGHLASVAPDLARVLLALPGREAEAVEVLELGERSAIEDDVDAQVRLRAVRARVLSRRGEHVEAESLARDAVDRAWKTDYPILRGISLDTLAEVLERTGRVLEATEALERAITVHEAKGDVSSANRDRRAMAELRSAKTRAGKDDGG